MERIFIDVNIAMYAAGTPHPLREPCQRVIYAAGGGQIDAWTDVEVFQEILYRYIHIQRKEKGLQVFDHFHRVMLGKILPVEDADVVQARLWVDSYPSLSPCDLIHLAVMNRHQIHRIITCDQGFAVIPGIDWLDPLTFQG